MGFNAHIQLLGIGNVLAVRTWLTLWYPRYTRLHATAADSAASAAPCKEWIVRCHLAAGSVDAGALVMSSR